MGPKKTSSCRLKLGNMWIHFWASQPPWDDLFECWELNENEKCLSNFSAGHIAFGENMLFQIDLKVHLLATSIPSDWNKWEGFSILLKDTSTGLFVIDGQSSCGGDVIWHCLFTRPRGGHHRGHRRLCFSSSHSEKWFELYAPLLW